MGKWQKSMKEMEEKFLKEARERALGIEKGFAQGKKDGLELGRRGLETMIDSLRRLLEGMGRLHRDLYEQYEQEMIRLVFAVTRKILQQDFLLPKEGVREILRRVFQYVHESRDIVIRLNPKDHQYLLGHPEGLPFPWKRGEGEGIKIVADPAITRGGCFLETSFGDIDATLENQLDQISSLIWQKFVPSASLDGPKDP